MFFTRNTLEVGSNLLIVGLNKMLHTKVKQNWIRDLDDGENELVRSRVRNGMKHDDAVKEVADIFSEDYIFQVVGTRLKGAIACYETGMQLECVRHLLIALDAVCNIIGWDEASAYLNEQNRQLYAEKKQRETA